MGSNQTKNKLNNNNNTFNTINNDENEKKLIKNNDIINYSPQEELFFKVFRNKFIIHEIFKYLSPSVYSLNRYDNLALEDYCSRGLLGLLVDKLKLEKEEEKIYNVLGKTGIRKFMCNNYNLDLMKLVYERFEVEFKTRLKRHHDGKEEDEIIIWHYNRCSHPNPEIIKYLRLNEHKCTLTNSISVNNREQFSLLKIIIEYPIKSLPLHKEFQRVFIHNDKNQFGYELLMEIIKYLNDNLPKGINIEIHGVVFYEFLVDYYYPNSRFLLQGYEWKNHENLYHFFTNLGDFRSIKFISENDNKISSICDIEVLYLAIKEGHFEIFKYLYRNKYSKQYEFLYEFVKYYRYRYEEFRVHWGIFKYLYEDHIDRIKGSFPPDFYTLLTNIATSSDDLDLLQYLIEKEIVNVQNTEFIDSIHMIKALKQVPEFDEMKLLYNFIFKRIYMNDLICLRGSMDLIKYIIDKVDILESPGKSLTYLDMFARDDDLEFYKYFYSTKKSTPTFSSVTMSIFNGSHNVLKYVLKECNGFVGLVDIKCMEQALRENHIGIVKYLHEHFKIEFPQDSITKSLAIFASDPLKIDIIKYILSTGFEFNPSSIPISKIVQIKEPKIIELLSPYYNKRELCMSLLNQSSIELIKNFYLYSKNNNDPVFNGDQESTQLLRRVVYNYKFLKFLIKNDVQVLEKFKNIINSTCEYASTFTSKSQSICFQIYLDMGLIELTSSNLFALLLHPTTKSLQIFYSNLSLINSKKALKALMDGIKYNNIIIDEQKLKLIIQKTV